jgi:phosphonate transport system substrate-binding protein
MPSGSIFRALLWAAATSLCAAWSQSVMSQSAAPMAPPLQVGVIPNLSARLLIEQNQPLRVYLERRLGRPVEIVSAPDFHSFHERTLAGAYDVAITPAHMARLAQLDGRHTPIAAYAPSIDCVIVTTKESPITTVGGLRGKTLTFANPLSLVALHGRQWLSENGLRHGVDYLSNRVRSEDSVASMLLRGESAAAFLSGGELRSIPQEQRDRLRVLVPFGSVRAFVVLASPRLEDAHIQQLRSVFLEFPNGEEFKRFTASTGFTGVNAVAEADMRLFDPLLNETRRLLAAGR